MPSKSPPPALAKAPLMFRTAKSTGSQAVVDREGGKFSAGKISGVSVITTGEALGHGVWIDETFVAQVNDALAALEDGAKSRWTHPDMSSDGLGKLTSRIMDPTLAADGQQLFADQHFLQIGHKSPDGDLAAYLMDLADEDPKAYGLSIVFYRDEAASEQFRLEHIDANGEFKSPDPRNVHNYEHIRLGSLEAADAVDSPAANPNGLFSRKKDVAREADAIAMFALGLSSDRPEVVSLGIDPERVRGFASRFLSTHGLELKRKAMSAEAAPATDPIANDPAATPEQKPAETTPTTPASPEANSQRSEAARFKKAFGDQGAIWFADGLSFDEAQQRANGQLSDRLAAVEAQLKAGAKVTGEGAAAGFSAADDPATKRKGFASRFNLPGAAAK